MCEESNWGYFGSWTHLDHCQKSSMSPSCVYTCLDIYNPLSDLFKSHADFLMSTFFWDTLYFLKASLRCVWYYFHFILYTLPCSRPTLYYPLFFLVTWYFKFHVLTKLQFWYRKPNIPEICHADHILYLNFNIQYFVDIW